MAFFERRARVLFVCTENICRSPMAEGLLRQYLRNAGIDRRFEVSSAGTMVSQPGTRPDQRAQKVARAAGIQLKNIRANRVTEAMLVRSSFVFAMDRSHIRDLLAICPPEHSHKIRLILAHLQEEELKEVPDPYYGSYQGFSEVFLLLERAIAGLVPYLDQSS